MQQNDLAFIQDQIGYDFKNKDLLRQAFVRRSYSEENRCENNEVLEFVGDKVLDLIVVKLLTDKYGHFKSDNADYNSEKDFNEFISEYQEDKLTEIKKGLVKKGTLAKCVDNLGVADYLIMGKGDQIKGVQNEQSVKEDLFEAIIGAVAIDSGWNFKEMHDVVEVMLDIDSKIENEEVNYIQEIQEWVSWYNNSIPFFHFEKCSPTTTWHIPFNGVSQVFDFIIDNRTYEMKYFCLLKLDDDIPIFRGFGMSKKEARSAVCEVAYNYLEKKNMLFTIKDEIDSPSWELAINQLETLARRGYFSIPTYNFIEEHDEDGNPIWHCECHIEEDEHSSCETSASKKDAKKGAAYGMLKHVLSIKED